MRPLSDKQRRLSAREVTKGNYVSFGYPKNRGYLKEYCETELFQPRCGRNEVIVMSRARYGRMQIGRCVKKNLGYMGCHSSVLTLLDQKCSGRTSCQVRIPDPALDATKPCLEELKTYLEAQYQCVRVSQPSFTCSNNKQWVLTAPAGYITNAVVMDTNCGSMTSPLMIRALPGQKINLTLYNFDPILPQSHRQYNEPETGCDTYAHVIDKAAERSVPVCRGGARLGHVYVSANRSLELVLYKTRSDGYQHGPFVLYYEAIGCADITPPEGMWVKRRENEAQVGCHVTREVWTLVCVDGDWLGEISNCSKSIVLKSGDQQKRPHIGLSHGVSVIIIVTIAIGIGIAVLLCGIFVIKRMRKVSGRSGSNESHVTRATDEQEELEQLKVNYDNETRNSAKCRASEPEILQHVIYDKTNVNHGGYSPLHTCLHEAAHAQLATPEVLWKTNAHAPSQSEYEVRKCGMHKDNVAFVQPCTLTSFSDRTNSINKDPDPVASSSDVLDVHTYRPSEGQSVRSFHDTVYADRTGTCVHGRERVSRNPRNIYEPRRTRVLYTLNNSF
ncbi:hypothetical protein LSH36_864g00067 [Paralvinella palmiformis]|uniref:SUEL-type lectin domain-containing protein n=1 Tax=Paralvinella palmiformis TaxID=53620 RepID=A0AAD9MT59_9ANNE|nr:hypothetical protein LSH36_864g00067 [Paralvinella palmiformis]